MMNLFEIMQAAQRGQAMANMARQFGLSPAQAQGAVEALLPAFSMGLNRASQSPDLMSAFVRQLAGGAHARTFEGAQDGIPDHLVRQGEGALDTLFGSRDVSGRIARQAAAAAGLGVEVVQRMMPAMASMLLGGLSSSMQAQGYGTLLDGLARAADAGGAGGRAEPRGAGPAQGGFNPFGWGAAPPAPQPKAEPPGPGNPFDAIFAGMFGAAPSRPEPPPPPPPPQPTQAGFEALTRMFETGRQAQEGYLAGLQSIFGAPPGRPGPR